MSKLTAKMSRGEQPATQSDNVPVDGMTTSNSIGGEKTPAVVAADAIPENGSNETMATTKVVPKDRKRDKDRLQTKQERKAERKAAQEDRECSIM